MKHEESIVTKGRFKIVKVTETSVTGSEVFFVVVGEFGGIKSFSSFEEAMAFVDELLEQDDDDEPSHKSSSSMGY